MISRRGRRSAGPSAFEPRGLLRPRPDRDGPAGVSSTRRDRHAASRRRRRRFQGPLAGPASVSSPRSPPSTARQLLESGCSGLGRALNRLPQLPQKQRARGSVLDRARADFHLRLASRLEPLEELQAEIFAADARVRPAPPVPVGRAAGGLGREKSDQPVPVAVASAVALGFVEPIRRPAAPKKAHGANLHPAGPRAKRAPALSTIHSPVLSTPFARTMRGISAAFPSRATDMSRGIHRGAGCAHHRRE